MSATTETVVAHPASRKAGAGQAWVLILAMFLPILAIIALAPALPTLLDHFRDVPNARTVVPMLLTVPALCIALFGGVAGWLTDRYGRRNLILGAMLVYGLAGIAPCRSKSAWPKARAIKSGRIPNACSNTCRASFTFTRSFTKCRMIIPSTVFRMSRSSEA